MTDPSGNDPQTDGIVRDRIQITNETKNLASVREFVTRMVGQSHLERADGNKVILAVDEAVSNIIEHAFEEDRSGSIEVEIESDTERFRIMIRDSGKSFDPKRIDPVVDIRDHVKQGKRHGLGIFIMRQIMDEVNYSFKEGLQNELCLVKYITSG